MLLDVAFSHLPFTSSFIQKGSECSSLYLIPHVATSDTTGPRFALQRAVAMGSVTIPRLLQHQHILPPPSSPSLKI